MFSPTRAVTSRLVRFVSELRFPWLVALTAFLFVVDFAVPDFIPLADEILLGLLTALLASFKKSRQHRPIETTARLQDVPADR